MDQLSIKARDELLARVLLQHVLGAIVTQHDDGSAPSMYDLDVAYPDGRLAAAEVVSTRDAQAMSLAAATQREVYTDVAALTLTWFVTMRPEAHVRTLRRRLPAVLTDLERCGVSHVAYRSFESHQMGLADLGVAACSSTSASQRRPGFYLLSDWRSEWGGEGDDIVRRCDAFIQSVPDVTQKLLASRRPERHIVIVVTPDWVGPFGGIQHGPLPGMAPTLPDGINGVWLVTLRESPIRALYWRDGDVWREAEVTDEQITTADDPRRCPDDPVQEVNSRSRAVPPPRTHERRASP